MLIANLIPLLSRYSLGFNLISAPDGNVTLTIIPRRAEGKNADLNAAELQPIQITGTAAEIDAELAKGADGALGQLITARKTLGEQIAEQKAAAEAAAAEARKVAAEKTAKPASSAKPAASVAAEPKVDVLESADAAEPASLW